MEQLVSINFEQAISISSVSKYGKPKKHLSNLPTLVFCFYTPVIND